MKVLNKFFFHLIEKFRVLTQDDHMRKRRTTEERSCQGVRGWRIPQSLQSAEVLSGHIPSTKTCRRTELGLPALLPLSAMNTIKFRLGLKQPVSWLQSELAFTILKKDRYIYYITTGEIPVELYRENFISSHAKITCYLHTLRDHRRYGYVINRAFESNLIWSFTGVYILGSFRFEDEDEDEDEDEALCFRYNEIFKLFRLQLSRDDEVDCNNIVTPSLPRI